MIIHHLSDNNSILNTFISEIRDKKLQQDSMRFRRNIERIGEILGYEMSKTFAFENRLFQTPLGESEIPVINEQMVICSILRAGLPLHQGLLNYFDKAENTFISAYRHLINEEEFEIKVEYIASPSLEGKTLVLADPMLATGSSFVNVFHALKKMGPPAAIHLVSIIGSDPGVKYVAKNFPENTHLWIAGIDPELNEKGYIIPGLGDAGDLAFGPKAQH